MRRNLVLAFLATSINLAMGNCVVGDDTMRAGIAQFEAEVRPILVGKCFKCHGGKKTSNGLRVDSREALLKGGESGAAIVPGKLEDSPLVEKIRGGEDAEMPPDEPLAKHEVEALERWIRNGAPWPKYEKPASAKIAPTHPDDKAVGKHLQLWLRADTVKGDDGIAVTAWHDNSGGDRHLKATRGWLPRGAGNPPKLVHKSGINERPAVRFALDSGMASEASKHVDVSGNAAFTIVLVTALQPARGPVPYASVLGIGNPFWPHNPGKPLSALVEIESGADHQLDLAGGWSHDASLGPGSYKPLYGRPNILTIVKRPGPMAAMTRIFVDGRPSTKPPIARNVRGTDQVPDIRHLDFMGTFMGRAVPEAHPFQGDVGEVIVYNRALKDSERLGIEMALGDKYGIDVRGEERRGPTGDPAFNLSPHWAFQPIKSKEPPAVAGNTHAIDRFIGAKHVDLELSSNGAADRRTLVRRAYFDLVGLPPKPEEVEQFVNDKSTDAWPKLIDKLLASPRYGERWGRYWMDVVRYADTAGDNADYPVPEARLYRDYIIDSFNANKPYDRFLHEQLAGDVLAKSAPEEQRREMIIATTYIGLSRRYGTTPFEQHHLILEDTVDTTGRAILGLTMRCARCHDHKFDPTTQEDYYAMYGFFASTKYSFAGSEGHKGQKDMVALPGGGVAYGAQEGRPHDVALQKLGDPKQPGPFVARGPPKFLQGEESFTFAQTSSGRLEFARWLTESSNPLTARVMVNRIWQHHFGKALVSTPSNFGLNGAEPTHPELLDWLATQFVKKEWSIKAMHREIMTSAAYQRSSAHNQENATKDSDNRWYWRFDRNRLDAEAIRDAMLAVSGDLNLDRPGEHPFPPKSQWRFTQHDPFQQVYPSKHRSVYLMTQRFRRHPFFALFDGPDRNFSTGKRTRSTVPLQALYMMNNPFVREQGTAFAARVAKAASSPRDRVVLAYRLAFQRDPSDIELAKSTKYISDYRSRLEHAKVPAAELDVASIAGLCKTLITANEFLYVD